MIITNDNSVLEIPEITTFNFSEILNNSILTLQSNIEKSEVIVNKVIKELKLEELAEKEEIINLFFNCYARLVLLNKKDLKSKKEKELFYYVKQSILYNEGAWLSFYALKSANLTLDFAKYKQSNGYSNIHEILTLVSKLEKQSENLTKTFSLKSDLFESNVGIKGLSTALLDSMHAINISSAYNKIVDLPILTDYEIIDIFETKKTLVLEKAEYALSELVAVKSDNILETTTLINCAKIALIFEQMYTATISYTQSTSINLNEDAQDICDTIKANYLTVNSIYLGGKILSTREFIKDYIPNALKNDSSTENILELIVSLDYYSDQLDYYFNQKKVIDDCYELSLNASFFGKSSAVYRKVVNLINS